MQYNFAITKDCMILLLYKFIKLNRIWIRRRKRMVHISPHTWLCVRVCRPICLINYWSRYFLSITLLKIRAVLLLRFSSFLAPVKAQDYVHVDSVGESVNSYWKNSRNFATLPSNPGAIKSSQWREYLSDEAVVEIDICLSRKENELRGIEYGCGEENIRILCRNCLVNRRRLHFHRRHRNFVLTRIRRDRRRTCNYKRCRNVGVASSDLLNSLIYID